MHRCSMMVCRMNSRRSMLTGVPAYVQDVCTDEPDAQERKFVTSQDNSRRTYVVELVCFRVFM